MDSELVRRRKVADELGGQRRIDREHDAGRFTVRERIDHLLDQGSFREIGSLATTPMPGASGEILEAVSSAFICGFGTIGGRKVVIGAEDYTIQGGAVTIHLEKFKGAWTGYVEDLAYEYRAPLILLMHGGGGSVSAQSAKGYAYIVSAMVTTPILDLLNRVPVVTAVMGPVAGSGAARVVSSHYSVMSRPSGCMFAGGPPLVSRSLGADIDKFDLGGYDVHVRTAGNVDASAGDELEIFDDIRRFLSYLPQNVDHLPPVVAPVPPTVSGEELVALSAALGSPDFDIRAVIDGIVDGGTLFEIGAEFGQSLVTGLARIDGRPVGVIGHDRAVEDGGLTGLAADKQVRLVQLCDTFHLPILYLVDTAGVVGSVDEVSGGLLRRVVRAVHALHQATVPVITLHIGRCHGIAGMATTSPNRLVMRFAWPTATAEDDGGVTEPGDQAGLWPTVESFGVEEMIDPSETADVVRSWFGFGSESISPCAKVGAQFRP